MRALAQRLASLEGIRQRQGAARLARIWAQFSDAELWAFAACDADGHPVAELRATPAHLAAVEKFISLGGPRAVEDAYAGKPFPDLPNGY